MPAYQFHPAVEDWFSAQFGRPSEVQVQAWPAIQAGRNTLIAAPTGSGKTLAAFMAAIDQLVHEGLRFPLADQTQVLYVSPLKALSNDIHRNLELPLNGIRDALLENGYADVPIRAQVRTGDTKQSERAMMKRYPPHILVTTPESLFILLTSDSGRDMLKSEVSRMNNDSGVVTRMCGGQRFIIARSDCVVSPVRTCARIGTSV